MRRALHRPRTARGVALLAALIMVALAAVLATAIGFRSALAARRAVGTFSVSQGVQFAAGAEAIAAYVLTQDKQDTSHKQDSPDQDWAQPYGPTELEAGVTLEASLEDQQGRFNINSLLASDGTVDAGSQQIFKRLLELTGLESKWAAMVTDWIDSDMNVTLPDGAEDSTYLSQQIPYRTANRRISSISELLALPDFGRERYEKLRPYISALPGFTTINTCTAPGLLLDALSQGQVEYSVDTQALSRRRQSGCYPTLEDLQTALGEKSFQTISANVGMSSDYFRLRSWVTIGSTQFTLYSLMYRSDSGGSTRPILRTFGTE